MRLSLIVNLRLKSVSNRGETRNNKNPTGPSDTSDSLKHDPS